MSGWEWGLGGTGSEGPWYSCPGHPFQQALKVRSKDIPALVLPRKPEFDLLFPNFLVISHLEYLLKIEE